MEDLVDALALPTWKHPQLHSVEWLYQSGKLKVTQKVRLSFSVGEYADTVICDVLPMDACPLLLGRPWQYDRRATHEGRSNTYSFWDAGRRCVLQSMFAEEIKVDTNISLKKKKVSKIVAKPRTVLIQGGGDDVPVSAVPKTDHITNSNILMMGTMALKIPSLEPEPEEVKPNFRTPSWINVGAISVQVT